MTRYEEGLHLIEASCGNGKDNAIALATIASEPNANGIRQPHVRDVSAYYEDGVFYITTSAASNKVLQIEQNSEAAFSVSFEGIYGTGTAKNLGWVLAPQNADLRTKLRQAFADWYDQANNEQDQSCIILALHITKASIFRDHGALQYHLDLINQTETP